MPTAAAAAAAAGGAPPDKELGSALTYLADSLKELRAPRPVGMGAATSYEEYVNLRSEGGGATAGFSGTGSSSTSGHVATERIRMTRQEHPEFEVQQGWVQIAADLEQSPDEKIAIMDHYRRHIEEPAGGHATIKNCGYAVAKALAACRDGKPLEAEAWNMALYRALQSIANSESKRWETVLPLFKEDPGFLPGLSASERAALAAYHREHKLLREALQSAGVPAKPGGGGAPTKREQAVLRKQQASKKAAAAAASNKAGAPTKAAAK
jgi:hypothetical protein